MPRFENCNKFHNDICPMIEDIKREFTFEELTQGYTMVLGGRGEEVLRNCEACQEFENDLNIFLFTEPTQD